MRFVADSGLWTTGPTAAPAPLTAVLELAGAVLSWPVDRSDADMKTVVRLTVTDIARADWLWRVVGENGHAAIVAALAADVGAVGERDVPDVGFLTGALDPLWRLALGHWLQRWWPASRRDGIAELDGALLGGELAVLTAAAEDFFGDGTLDSEVPALLRPHMAALAAARQDGDRRIVDLVEACAELAEDTGLGPSDGLVPATARRRDDYALAAGAAGVDSSGAGIASGVRSLSWAGVPPGVFDAAENTIDWRIAADGAAVRAVLGVELAGAGESGVSPQGIAVSVRSAALRGAGELDDAGRARLELVDDANVPVAESVAWKHDWRDLRITVGVGVDESAEIRDRVRAVARARLRRANAPGGDAYLAEVLAAESDY
mgnify:FL=1